MPTLTEALDAAILAWLIVTWLYERHERKDVPARTIHLHLTIRRSSNNEHA